MRAVWYERFGAPPELRVVSDPEPSPDGAVLEVAATGVCRSDWHAWKGHDPDVTVPHVGGHELAGRIVAVGGNVRHRRVGERVTVPFVCACGTCAECVRGDHQVCRRQTQPGFTHWGSFAEFVAIDFADTNLVPLPEDLDFATAAALGCRFGTAFRAVLRQGRVGAGTRVAVYGCGGAGLSAVMIAAAAGAEVVAVDIAAPALALARSVGAAHTVDASTVADPAAVVRELTEGGADVSLDCLGGPETCAASVRSLRRRGRHVQVGLLPPATAGARGDAPTPAAVPMDRVVAYELEVVGSHGLAAYEYPAMLAMIGAGRLRPERLIGRRIGLAEIPAALTALDAPTSPVAGVTIAEVTRGSATVSGA